MTSCRLAALSLAATLVIGCDNPPSVAVDASASDAAMLPDAGHDAGSDAGFVIAPHAATEGVPDLGGARLPHPQLVVITYADDPNRDTLEAHAAWLATSDWLTTVGAEYGIGAGSVLANVRRTDDAPDVMQGSDIEALLEAGVADHSLPRGTDGTFANVLYLLYFPEHTRITDPSLGDSCVGYGGYHYEAPNGGEPFSYAVIPNCPHFAPPLSGLEFEEAAVTHEVIEAATDARPLTSPAWSFPSTGSVYSPWLFVGAELADLCALRVSPVSYPMEGGFYASRSWSNAAALANDRDPCLPADPSVPYYAVSVTPDYVQRVTPGTTVTYGLDIWTTQPIADFQLYAVAAGGFMPPVSVDRTRVNNGDHATLTIEIPAGTPRGSYALIYVELGISATEYSATPVAVYIP